MTTRNKNLGRKRIEASFFKKKSKPHEGEEKSIILQEPFRTSSERGKKSFPKPSAKEKWNITSKSLQKKRKVLGSSRTQNFVQKKVRV